jgi:hypothetical protein
VLGEGQQRGAKAAGELGGDAWSGAGAVAGLGRCGNGSGGGTVMRQRRAEEEEELGRGARDCFVNFKSSRDFSINQNSPLL